MKKLLMILLCVLLSSCNMRHVPHKIFRLQTTDGKVIRLSCPEIDPDWDTFSYIYSKECYVLPDDAR